MIYYFSIYLPTQIIIYTTICIFLCHIILSIVTKYSYILVATNQMFMRFFKPSFNSTRHWPPLCFHFEESHLCSRYSEHGWQTSVIILNEKRTVIPSGSRFYDARARARLRCNGIPTGCRFSALLYYLRSKSSKEEPSLPSPSRTKTRTLTSWFWKFPVFRKTRHSIYAHRRASELREDYSCFPFIARK